MASMTPSVTRWSMTPTPIPAIAKARTMSEGSDDERYSSAVNADQAVPSLPAEDEQITSSPVRLPARVLVRRTVNHSSPAVATPAPTIAYHTPTAPTVPYATNPRGLVRRAHVVMSSSPTPAAPAKRPFTDVEGAGDERDEDSGNEDADDDEDDSNNTPVPLRTADLPPARRRIFDLAAGHLRLTTFSTAPYADGLLVDKMAINAWYTALKSLRASHGYQGGTAPTTSELALLKKRFHQVKGTVKTVSREVVMGVKGYDFKQDLTPEAIAHNRQLVTSLLEKDSFVSLDPKNRNRPGTLFEHTSLQQVLNRSFYNNEGNSEAVLIPEYFANSLPEEGLAFIVTAVQCTIMEYQTGERIKSRMSAKTWQKIYEKHLKVIRDWKVYTTNSGSNLTQQLQIRMIQNARYAKVDVTPEGGEPAALSDNDFAANEA
ncbi:hypothetical protein B0H16DRAFT_891102 [Mycena metata]|uniref:DUF6532 domain-containing protein n=1 Tax=Mycena metata TaxID=1033252 RepID=A0AAD7IRR1_9AGAR|nr:hypothetical protein B0H16DRAFT_891102 [Mycena metata]